MMNKTSVYDESDCCGNGCANCILDMKAVSSAHCSNVGQKNASHRVNLLQNYRKFRLLSWTAHIPTNNNREIYELHFKYADQSLAISDSDLEKDDSDMDWRRRRRAIDNGQDNSPDNSVAIEYDNHLEDNDDNVSIKDLLHNDDNDGNEDTETEKEFILYMKPGHHLMLRVPWQEIPIEKRRVTKEDVGKTSTKYLLRPYSPFWWHEYDLEFKILVNFHLEGPMSSYFRCSLKEGDILEFRGPIGVYDYQADTSQGTGILLILTQGIAIAPVIPIIEQILQNEDDLQRVIHLSCFRHLHDICFRDKIHNFNHFWNYKGYVFLSRQKCNRPECVANNCCIDNCPEFSKLLKYGEQFHSGRLNDELLGEILQKSMKMDADRRCLSAIISGSPEFQKHYQNTLLSSTFKIQFHPPNIHLL